MKKQRIFIFFIVTAASFILAQNALAENDGITNPTVEAHGAILIDAKTGRVLWGKDEYAPLAMASTTKIMTAVLALESGRMDETVIVSSKAASAPKVKMGLSTGEKIRLGDLMQALMLESSNDAAVAIAEHLSGTVEDFCCLMTQKAKDIGAKDTIFETPNGLDAGNHHSTPYDLAVITRYAFNVPGFVELINTSSASFRSDKRGYALNNRNRLLNEYQGANGVKTGFTNKAGHCFVGAAKRDDMQLISVVLASGWGPRGRAQKFTDTKEILDFGFSNYQYEIIITESDNAGTMPITRSRSEHIDYEYAAGVTIPLNRQEKENISVIVNVPDQLKAPVNAGDAIGSAAIYIDQALYAEVLILATDTAIRHDLKTSIEKVLGAYFGQIIRQPVEIILPEFENSFN